ncbi:MAG TPA: glycosyltransferase family 39 protein [Thermoanaerobaculia bacterium]|nr:glycosyltransferase family 39 protein [Thermoanaerobaculia bacterium]
MLPIVPASERRTGSDGGGARPAPDAPRAVDGAVDGAGRVRAAAAAAPSGSRHGTCSGAGAGYALGRFVIRHYRSSALLVLAVMACNVFVGLGTANVNDFDEARYGVSAFEMQQHRAPVVTTYAGQREVWALKPPLGYWLMALSMALFGGSALAMRLPSALCALVAVGVTMRWARRWFDRRLAILAGLVLATTFGFISHHGARSGDFDADLTLILLLAAVGLPGLGESPWQVVRLAALLACGFLLKSFAIAPMVLIAAGYLVWTGAWRRQRLLPWLAAGALFAAIVGAWVLARWQAEGSPDFFLRMLREDVLQRSTSIVDKSTSSPIGYVTGLFDRFAPWPLLLLAAAGMAWWRRGAGSARRRPRREVAALLALWAGVPLVFYSLVRTQHHWYLDPTYPALAMLAAGSALLLVERSPLRLRALALFGLVVLPLAFCEARLVARVLLKPPSADQRFLRALAPAVSGCGELRTTCRLVWSERFILEVVDGFEVVEPAAAGTVASPVPAAACLLVGKSAWRRPPAPAADRLPAPDRLLAGSDGYALYRAAGAAISPARQPVMGQ